MPHHAHARHLDGTPGPVAGDAEGRRPTTHIDSDLSLCIECDRLPVMTPMRRTQAERRAATRTALLDATLACLVELGHTATTTTEICRRAGVSQGALFRYWDTKADLLTDAVEVLYGRLFDLYRARLDEVAAAEDRLRAGVRALWDLYRRPDLLAALELYVAARTDPELRRCLVRLEAPHEERTLALAEELFLGVPAPDVDAADRAAFRWGISMVIDTIQGAAVRAVALDDVSGIDDELDLLVDLVRPVLGPTDDHASSRNRRC